MNTVMRLARLVLSDDVAAESKARLIYAKIRRRLGARGEDVPVGVRGLGVFIAAESFTTDWNVFNEIFIGNEYGGVNFFGATVLDVGAHKGYFAAYVFARGARRVISYEPEPRNFTYLERAAAETQRWDVRPVAIAAAAGSVDLALDASWSHSIVRDRHAGARTITVEAVTLEQVLREAGQNRVVVKIDIEGAEGDAIAAVPAAAWTAVDAMVVEVHPWACDPQEICDLLGTAGMHPQAVPDARHPLLRFTRQPATLR